MTGSPFLAALVSNQKATDDVRRLRAEQRAGRQTVLRASILLAQSSLGLATRVYARTRASPRFLPLVLTTARLRCDSGERERASGIFVDTSG